MAYRARERLGAQLGPHRNVKLGRRALGKWIVDIRLRRGERRSEIAKANVIDDAHDCHFGAVRVADV